MQNQVQMQAVAEVQLAVEEQVRECTGERGPKAGPSL